MDQARAEMLDGFEKMMTDPQSVASLLSENVAAGDWRLMFWERDQIRKLSIEDLQQAAERYLVPSNLTIGTFIPDETPMRAAIAGIPDYKSILRGYKGDQTISAGEQFDPTPANIEARTVRSTVGPIKLAYLKKVTRANLVTLSFAIHFGNEKSLRNRAIAGQLVGNLLMRGTAKHDMTSLRAALTASKTQMVVNGDATGARVSLVTDHDHLATALRLAAEILRQPAFPESEFDEVKRQTLAEIESSRTEPEEVARRAFRRALSPYPPGHVRYVATLDELLTQVRVTTLADVRGFFRDFYGIGTAELAIVGDFDPEQATSVIRELFADWKSAARYERVTRLYKPVGRDTRSFSTPDKENAIFLAGTNLEVRDDDSDYAALVLGNYMLGGGFLNSRLASRIRQKEGLSYSVSSQFSADSLDKVASFTASAICAPQNQSKVITAFEEEVSRAISSGFSAEELAAAKSGYLEQRRVELSNDDSLASALADHLFLGRTFAWEKRYEAKVDSLQREQVNNDMRQFINPDNLIVVLAGDFSKMGR